MPQQPMVMRIHFYLPGGEGRRGLKSAAHHVEYIGSQKKHELLIDPDEQAIDRTTALESASHHVAYAAHEGSLGYIGPLAHDPKAAQREILESQGPVWRVIVSAGEADAVAMGGALTTREGWEHATTAIVPDMIRQLGLDPDRTHWIAAAHRWQSQGGKNPHVHLLMWQTGEPSRQIGKWSDAERRAIRRSWASTLYAPERERAGAEKTRARDDARVIVLETVRAAHERRHPSHQQFHQDLDTRLRELGAQLPGKGRLAYGFMPAPVKAQTQDLIRWLWAQDPTLREARDRFVQAAQDLASVYWSDAEYTRDPEARQRALDTVAANAEADLIQRLAAPVLQAARDTKRPGRQAGGRRSLLGAMDRLARRAERDARLTQSWLEEAQWRERMAQAATARQAGIDLAL